MEGLRQKNARLLLTLLCLAAGMLSLCFFSLPLYKRFCAVTGLGGTPGTVVVATAGTSAPVRPISDRVITLRFNTSVAPDMPWIFKPEQAPVPVKVGADGFASFLAENKSDTPVSGVAVYNVTPFKAGRYFYKTQCFCFGEQTLLPRQAVHMPVAFYVDPAILNDPNMDDVHTITLSYTFFRKDSQDLEAATQRFYNTDVAPGSSAPKKPLING